VQTFTATATKKPVMATDMKAMFQKPVPYTYILKCSINGEAFTIEGKGTGNGSDGSLRCKYRCTTGQNPMSWKACAPLLAYGMKVFVHYPNGMEQFFQNTMPTGYSEDRVFTYEDGGVIKSHREISWQEGMVVSKGTMVAENFPEDSPILTQNLKAPLPPQEVITDYRDGIRSMCNFVFPVKSGGYYGSALTTINRPLRESNVARAEPHYQRTQFKQTRDTDDDSDHVIQQEILEAYQCSLIEG